MSSEALPAPVEGSGLFKDPAAFVQAFRRLSETEQQAVIRQLPPFARPLVNVASTMSDESLTRVAAGVQGLQTGKPDAKGIAVLFSVYKRLPAGDKAEMQKLLPAQVAPFVGAIDHLTAENVEYLAAGAIEASKGNAKSVDSKCIAKAWKVYDSLPVKTQLTIKTQLVEKKLVTEDHMALFEEASEGLTEEDVVEAVELLRSQDEAASGEEDEKRPVGDFQEVKVDDEEDEKPSVMRRMIFLMARVEARRLARWVRSAPMSVRVLNFLCGLLGFSVLLLWSIWVSLFLGYFFQFVLQLWLLVFNFVIIGLNANIRPCQRNLVPKIERWVMFLSTTTGRGVLLFFVGALDMSSCTANKYTLYPMIGVGGLSVLVGLITMAVGARASGKLNRVLAKIDSEERLKAFFYQADKDGNNGLDKKELAEVCTKMGVDLGEQETILLLDMLDADNDGRISFEEFKTWWMARGLRGAAARSAVRPDETLQTPLLAGEPDLEGGADRKLGESGGPGQARAAGAGVAAVQAAQDGVRDTPSVLAVVNYLAILAYMAGGVIGFALEMRDIVSNSHFDRILPLYVNLWVVFLGLVLLATELRSCAPQLLGSFSRWVEQSALFLGTVVGRGVFYFFCAALAIAQWNWWNSYIEVANIISAASIFFVGIVNIVYGRATLAKLGELKSGMLSAGNAQKLFADADKNGDGKLSRAEILALAATLGVPLGRRDAELMFSRLDANLDGSVEKEEFVAWYESELLV